MENLSPSTFVGIPLSESDLAAPRLASVRGSRGRELVIGRGVSVSYPLQPPFSSRQHRHKHVQIAVALDPVDAILSWRSQGRWEERKVSGRHGWLVPPGVTHRAKRLGDGHVMVLYVDPAYAREIGAPDCKDVAILDLPMIERSDLLVWQLNSAFGEICRRPTAAPPLFVESIGTALATRLLSAHFGENERRGGRPTGLPGERLARVLNYIESHLAGDLSRGALATAANLSVCHFSRMFKISTGHAPHEYVMLRRQIYARELLKDGRMKRSAVATEAGFSDQTHLGRHLKKACALTVTPGP